MSQGQKQVHRNCPKQKASPGRFPHSKWWPSLGLWGGCSLLQGRVRGQQVQRTGTAAESCKASRALVKVRAGALPCAPPPTPTPCTGPFTHPLRLPVTWPAALWHGHMIMIWGDLPNCACPLQPWAEEVGLSVFSQRGERSLYPFPAPPPPRFSGQAWDLGMQHEYPLYLPLPPCLLGKALSGCPAEQIRWTQLWLQFLISFLL